MNQLWIKENKTCQTSILTINSGAFVLTWSAQEKKHHYPVGPEQHEAKEGPEGLQDQQGKVDEHFTRHMEQGDGESHTLSHDEHHNQENYLASQTKTNEPVKSTSITASPLYTLTHQWSCNFHSCGSRFNVCSDGSASSHGATIPT